MSSSHPNHPIIKPSGTDYKIMFRATENGVAIDARGELDGREFTGPTGLGETLRESEAAAGCAVLGVFRYALGREPELAEKGFMRGLEGRFEESGYRFPELMREIATSAVFRTTSGPRQVETEAKSAGKGIG